MWYDVLIVCILLFFTIRGAAKGVIWQVAHIAGIVMCFVFADMVSNLAGPYVHLEPPLNHWVVMVGSYLVFTFVCFAIARSMTSWVEKNKMKEFDRHLGAAMGLIKGVILALILTFAVVTVSEDARAALKKSHSGRLAALLMDRLHPILPEKLHAKIGDYIHLLDSDDLDLRHAHDHDHGSHDGHSQTPGGALDPFLDPFAAPAPNSNPNSSIPSTTPPAGSFWNQVSGLLSNEAQRVVSDAMTRLQSDPAAQSKLQQDLLSALKSAPQAEQQTLQQQIVQYGANQLPGYLAWVNSQKTQPSVPATPSTPLTPTAPSPSPIGTPTELKASLIRDLANAYSSVPHIRQQIEADIQNNLSGLPESVTVAVLQDWRADALGQRPDPDPQTTNVTTIEQRIVRQLQLAGIALDRLPAYLQQRLRGVQAQGTSPQGNPL